METEMLPTTGVAGEAISMIQAPHRLARLPCSIDAKPTLDANAYGPGKQQTVGGDLELAPGP